MQGEEHDPEALLQIDASSSSESDSDGDDGEGQFKDMERLSSSDAGSELAHIKESTAIASRIGFWDAGAHAAIKDVATRFCFEDIEKINMPVDNESVPVAVIAQLLMFVNGAKPYALEKTQKGTYKLKPQKNTWEEVTNTFNRKLAPKIIVLREQRKPHKWILQRYAKMSTGSAGKFLRIYVEDKIKDFNEKQNYLNLGCPHTK